jgi:hypothetical protein
MDERVGGDKRGRVNLPVETRCSIIRIIMAQQSETRLHGNENPAGVPVIPMNRIRSPLVDRAL